MKLEEFLNDEMNSNSNRIKSFPNIENVKKEENESENFIKTDVIASSNNLNYLPPININYKSITSRDNIISETSNKNNFLSFFNLKKEKIDFKSIDLLNLENIEFDIEEEIPNELDKTKVKKGLFLPINSPKLLNNLYISRNENIHSLKEKFKHVPVSFNRNFHIDQSIKTDFSTNENDRYLKSFSSSCELHQKIKQKYFLTHKNEELFHNLIRNKGIQSFSK